MNTVKLQRITLTIDVDRNTLGAGWPEIADKEAAKALKTAAALLSSLGAVVVDSSYKIDTQYDVCPLRTADGCGNCSSNSRHICEEADANRFIELPIYSEEKNADGTYDLIGYRKEYVD